MRSAILYLMGGLISPKITITDINSSSSLLYKVVMCFYNSSDRLYAKIHRITLSLHTVKCIALILASFITFLVIKPGVDMIHTQLCDTAVEGCDEDCSPFSNTEDSTDNKCNGKTCCLFQVCNSSGIMVNEMSVLQNDEVPVISFKQDFSYVSTFTNQFISDFWHPPKLV